MSGGGRAGLDISFKIGGIVHLAFDLPGEKVNKLTTAVMEELAAILDDLKARGERGEARGLLITSGKPGTFIAGADVAEIERITDPEDGAAKSRRGQEILEALARLPFPSVSAVGGACLGGGYELALACTRIVAADDSRVQIGLPEVRLGIIPGFGGTQRLPRRAGLCTALDVILAGKTLDPRRALRAGLVDLLVPAAILEREAVRELIRLAGRDGSGGFRGSAATTAGWKGSTFSRRRIISWVLERNPLGRALVASRARKLLVSLAPAAHYPAPYRALDSILASYKLPREKAFRNESRLLGEMIVTQTSKNLVFLFNAQNAARKAIPTAARDTRGEAAGHVPSEREVRKVGVVGAGVMGAGIAQVVADRDMPVRLKDVSWEVLARGLAAIASGYRSRMSRGRMDRREFDRKMARVSPAIDWSGFSNCDLVIEAVLERLDVKRQVVAEAESALREDAILATNTSSLLVSDIAAQARRPGRIVGMHFFNPPTRMPLVEVVAGKKTEPHVLASSVAFVARIGKVPVVVRDGPGFLVNRLLMPYLGQALSLAEEGGDMKAIDRECVAWGMPMGPFRLLDEIGLDIAAHAARELAAAFPQRAPSSAGSLDRLVAAGRLGVKSGLGFYSHPPRQEGGKRASRRGSAAKKPVFDLEVVPIVRSETAMRRSGQKSERGASVMDLLVLPIVNEAARCLEEEVVRSARDVDLAMVMGAGFPPFRGGPLRYADSLGAAEVCSRLDRLAGDYGQHLAPAAYLRLLAHSSRRFHES